MTQILTAETLDAYVLRATLAAEAIDVHTHILPPTHGALMLYGIDEHPELKTLVARKFGEPGDVQTACELVLDSSGLQRTKELATFHAQAAVDACCSLPASPYRDGLIQLCHVVLSRSS